MYGRRASKPAARQPAAAMQPKQDEREAGCLQVATAWTCYIPVRRTVLEVIQDAKYQHDFLDSPEPLMRLPYRQNVSDSQTANRLKPA